MKNIEDMSEKEKNEAIRSARYILEEFFENGKEGVSALAAATGYPAGVISAALCNIFVSKI